MPLVIVESPYRSLIEPIMAYIEGMDRTQPNQMVTVVLPEFLPKRFWQRFLHNQLASQAQEGADGAPEHGRRRSARTTSTRRSLQSGRYGATSLAQLKKRGAGWLLRLTLR